MKIFRFGFPLSVVWLAAAAIASAQQPYQISTYAGIGTVEGFQGDLGPATAGQMAFPIALAFDPQNNLYVADYYNYLVRLVSNKQIISTYAGTGTLGCAGDNGPATTTTTSTGTFINSSATLSLVHGLAIDRNSINLYIADTGNHLVRRVTNTGLLTTFAGTNATNCINPSGNTGDGGPATAARLTSPYGVAVDSSGNVYISDIGTYSIREVNGKTGIISTFAGTGSYGYSGDGGPANQATFGSPYALAFDSTGNLFVSDITNQAIRKITPGGTISTVIKGVAATSLAIDAAGNIYFPNGINNTVEELIPGGSPFVIAGNGTQGFSGDGGPATFAQLNSPLGVAVDSSGNVYIADSGNMVVRKLTPATSPSLIGVVNAASYQNGTFNQIAPGEIVTIFGSGIGPSTLTLNQPDSNGNYSKGLAGTVVQINSQNAPIIYTSANQVAVVVPYAVPPGTTVPLQVFYQGQPSLPANVNTWVYQPGIFAADASGSGQAAAFNQDGTTNGAASPAPLGSVVSIYETGEGQTSPGGTDGATASNNLALIPRPNATVTATVGGQPAVVTYAGGAPGFIAGIMQVNIQVPTSLSSQVARGSVVSLPVVVQVGIGQLGTYVSQSTVTVAVTTP